MPMNPVTVAEVRAKLAREYIRVIDMFRACDEDGDGRITKREFRAALPLLGFGAGGRAAIDALFATFDLDSSNYLDLQELNTVLRYEGRRQREKAMALQEGGY